MAGKVKVVSRDSHVWVSIVRLSDGLFRWEVNCFRGFTKGAADTYSQACLDAGLAAEALGQVNFISTWDVTDPAATKGGAT